MWPISVGRVARTSAGARWTLVRESDVPLPVIGHEACGGIREVPKTRSPLAEPRPGVRRPGPKVPS